MSVTFTCPEAPRRTTRRPCDFDGCCPSSRCGYCRDGVEEVVTDSLPFVNLANGNAKALLRLLGLDAHDLYGQLAVVKDIAGVRQRITRLRNSVTARSAAVREPRQEPRIIDVGLSDDGILERLERLDTLLAVAQQHGWSVSWL